MASNIQRGTRGLSAGDWVRLQRLKGARNYQIDKPNDTVNPIPVSEPESGRKVYTSFGLSKIRRTASGYTDYLDSQTADYVLETTNVTCGTNLGVARSLIAQKLCTCVPKSAISHNGICRICTHDPIVVRK